MVREAPKENRISQYIRETRAELRKVVWPTREEGINFNRRYWMKDGTFAWQPRKGDPNIERPAGPADPELGICCFEPSGKGAAPLAAYIKFAMHPHTIRGSAFSADYPGRLAKRMAEYQGNDSVTPLPMAAPGTW